jgi:hypothetical protein
MPGFPCSLSRGTHPASFGLFWISKLQPIRFLRYVQNNGMTCHDTVAPGSAAHPHPRSLSRSSTILGPGLDSLRYLSNSDALWYQSTRAGKLKMFLRKRRCNALVDQVVDTIFKFVGLIVHFCSRRPSLSQVRRWLTLSSKNTVGSTFRFCGWDGTRYTHVIMMLSK